MFKIFNKISTWELLTDGLGARPPWADYCFTTYNRILSAAMDRGERVYSAAYIVPNPPFGQVRKHGNRQALRAILGVPTDTALGFINARRAVVKLVDVDRKQFLRSATLGVGTLALGPVAALLDGSEPTPVPVRVGATEIKQIHTATQVFESWDSTYGGGLGREAVLAQLRWSAGLLNTTCPARLRTELFSAVGDLADLTAFMAFDSGAHDEARRVFRFALACAEQADDWHLRAQVLGNMALQAMATGDPVEAATIGTAALDAAGTIRSRRATDDLRELARYCTRHSKVDGVDALRQRITTTLLRS